MISAIFDFLNLIVLSITMFFLIKYTRATQMMAKYQITPAIDVNMVYDENIGKTYFWFSNESSLPGLVFLEFRKNKENRQSAYKPLRIPPRRSMKTAATFEFNPVDGDELTLYISIRPCIEKTSIKFEFEKSYKFVSDRWDETSWSFPDPKFPVSRIIN